MEAQSPNHWTAGGFLPVAVVNGICLVIFPSGSYSGGRDAVDLCREILCLANILSLISSNLFEPLFFSKLTFCFSTAAVRSPPCHLMSVVRVWRGLRG